MPLTRLAQLPDAALDRLRLRPETSKQPTDSERLVQVGSLRADWQSARAGVGRGTLWVAQLAKPMPLTLTVGRTPGRTPA